MKKVHVDIETFSAADLPKQGVYRYAEDPSTEILCIAYAIDKLPVQLWTPGQNLQPLIDLFADNQTALYAHNSQFERILLNSVAGRILGLPGTPAGRWFCTAAKAAALALPRKLSSCAKALRVVEKDEAGRRIMLKLSRPKKLTANNTSRHTPETNPEDFEALYRYCKNDVEVERAIDAKLPDLSDAERQVFLWDQEVNDRGVQTDRATAQAVVEMAQVFTNREQEKCLQITGALPSQRAAVMAWCATQKYELSGYDKNAIAEALQDLAAPPLVKEVLQIRQETAKTSVKKYDALLRATTKDSRLHGAFLYHGAGTGRWTGRLMQLQNLPRGSIKNTEQLARVMLSQDVETVEALYGPPMDAFSSGIRAMLLAKPNHIFVQADLSNIEGRVLAWIAGEDWKVQAFKDFDNGTAADLYIVAAGKMYGQDRAEEYRQIGKVSELSLGYQGGTAALQRMAALYGVTFKETQAAQIVSNWRETNNNIQALWRATEAAAIEAMQTHKPVEFAQGRASFIPKGQVLYLVLPSGRRIAYPSPALEPGKFRKPQLTFMGDEGFGWRRQTTYGGSLVNNLVQGIARDILVNGALAAEVAGLPVVIHVHDEIVVEIPTPPKADLPNKIQQLEQILSSQPLWAKGLPLRSAGWAGKRYKK